MKATHLGIAQALCAAQDGRCFYCGVEFSGPARNKPIHRRCEQWTRDHLKPVCDGHGAANNIVLACLKCNEEKGARYATADELARAAIVHTRALRLSRAFNGGTAPSWPELNRHQPESPQAVP